MQRIKKSKKMLIKAITLLAVIGILGLLYVQAKPLSIPESRKEKDILHENDMVYDTLKKEDRNHIKVPKSDVNAGVPVVNSKIPTTNKVLVNPRLPADVIDTKNNEGNDHRKDDKDHDVQMPPGESEARLLVEDTGLRHRAAKDEADDDEKHRGNFKPLKIDELQPPDHLEAVRMEQDGHLNRDYKKEIFLGNHEEIEEGTDEDKEKKLKDIFYKVDSNQDGFIHLAELNEWIIQKVQEHFDEATEENENIFATLDTDADGFITWQEFHIQFLIAKGHTQDKAQKHSVDYETIPLKNDEKEHLIRFKFRWADADEIPQDNKLSKQEFYMFRHPEQSQHMMVRMVQDIIDNLDKDGDGKVTEEEFVALPPGEVDAKWEESDRTWQRERSKEFQTLIDLDKDGKVTKEELTHYVDPQNPNHASLEAKNLIHLADNNADGKLSLEEVLDNMELFMGSKMVDTARSFHDEM